MDILLALVWIGVLIYATTKYGSDQSEKSKKLDKGIQTIVDHSGLTNEKIFDEIVLYTAPYGYEIKSRSKNQLQLIKNKKSDIHWPWLLLVGIIPYLIYVFLIKKDNIMNITLDEEESSNDKKDISVNYIDEIERLASLLEKGYITRGEFEQEKNKIIQD